MELVVKRVEKLIKEAVVIMDRTFSDWERLAISPASSFEFGDYQTNFALSCSKIFKKAPKVFAEELINHIPENEIVEKFEVAGPGFINIFLKNNFIAQIIKESANNKWCYPHKYLKGTVVIDYSSPNIAKQMHVGHLRTTIIGDSIKRIMRYVGYEVVADNHLGDWGTQFGKLIVGYRNWLVKEAYANDPVAELERIYIKFQEESELDESLNELAREELKKVQAGDKENLKLWKEFVEVSVNEVKKIYGRMDIDFDTWYGESFYNEMMPGIVEELVEKGIVKEDDGALVAYFDEEENIHPCIIRKKDGAYLYSTSDLATIKFKQDTYEMNKAVYVTDDRQQAHFKQVFSIAKKAGWTILLDHVVFGIMSFKGVAISTRGGNTIHLSTLLDEAESRAYDIVCNKNPELPEEEKRNIAKVVGIGAVKYTDLSQNRTSNIEFSWEKALNFEGNTAPYLQYSYARVQSVIRKGAENGLDPDLTKEILLETDIEKQLAQAIIRFPEIVEKAADYYKPNLVAEHIFETAQKFSTFYNSCPILKGEERTMISRLSLSFITAHVIRQGLQLLGIETVDRM
jgi:arginyl-tRNA synthetase